jgi:ribosomal protein S20
MGRKTGDIKKRERGAEFGDKGVRNGQKEARRNRRQLSRIREICKPVVTGISKYSSSDK